MKGVIVDLGINNIQSLQHKITRLGIKVEVGEKAKDIDQSDFIILPGVGYFGEAMNRLRERDLIDTLNSRVVMKQIPILGICLGMQLFSEDSEEGNTAGLGWIRGSTKLLKSRNKKISIPHIGWSRINSVDANPSPLLNQIEQTKRFYFVHSYHLQCQDSTDIVTTSTYEDIEFVSSIRKQNIFGTQFHPEKSHRDGMQVVWNFLHCSGLV